MLVDPGEVTTPHTHVADGDTPGQEEVFVAMTDGQIAIDGTVHDVDAGGVVRVRPDVERNLLNRTDDATHVWLAFGAPPVGDRRGLRRIRGERGGVRPPATTPPPEPARFMPRAPEHRTDDTNGTRHRRKRWDRRRDRT